MRARRGTDTRTGSGNGPYHSYSRPNVEDSVTVDATREAQPPVRWHISSRLRSWPTPPIGQIAYESGPIGASLLGDGEFTNERSLR